MKLSAMTVVRILFRSLFIQGASTFKNMQYIGFMFSVAPGVREIGKAGHAIQPGMDSRYFNTQPYMAPTTAGIYLNLVENGRTEDAEHILQPVSSSLAALGDSFFWAVLKPAACLLCMIFALEGRLWGIAAVLIVYNAVHFSIMVYGFLLGYRQGPQAAFRIGKLISVERSGLVSLLVPLLCGAALVIAPAGMGIEYFKAIPVFLIGAVALYRKVDYIIIFYVLFILILLINIIT